MPSTRLSPLSGTLTPFLYPCLRSRPPPAIKRVPTRRANSTAALTVDFTRLDPPPHSYSISPFADRCAITVHAGAGGHGCVSFLREKFIEVGPPNGGDGGYGGNVYIQAVRGETSLHKLGRRPLIKAERGRNGQGKGRGGESGEDVLITVPVGTVVREVWRYDPIAEEARQRRRRRVRGSSEEEGGRDKWLLFPGTLPSSFTSADLPKPPQARRPALASAQIPAPIHLDLDEPMAAPKLLAAGAVGGQGNPNFITRDQPRPKYATKGQDGLKLALQLELKILADVGLVGLPNAGKSTLLRALSNSNARIGSWAFTTLQPNIGTVILDDHKGRPLKRRFHRNGDPRTNFTVADIPGLIEDAHLDKGLGHGFLRHIERAAVLAFVVDLSAGDAVAALKALWKEVGEYETFRTNELAAETQRLVSWDPFAEDGMDAHRGSSSRLNEPGQELPPLKLPPISAKPWLVIATKADLLDTQTNFADLQAYLAKVAEGTLEHPSGRKNAWSKRLHAIPISAIRAEGVQQIPEIVADLLEE